MAAALPPRRARRAAPFPHSRVSTALSPLLPPALPPVSSFLLERRHFVRVCRPRLSFLLALYRSLVIFVSLCAPRNSLGDTPSPFFQHLVRFHRVATCNTSPCPPAFQMIALSVARDLLVQRAIRRNRFLFACVVYSDGLRCGATSVKGLKTSEARKILALIRHLVLVPVRVLLRRCRSSCLATHAAGEGFRVSILARAKG